MAGLDPTLLGTFVLASLVPALTPGPGVIYIVARTLAQGRRAGLASVAGVALGNLGNALGAALGLAALFALSSFAFTLAQGAGAAYLVWLGVAALRERDDGSTPAEAVPAAPRRLFREGFVVALLNPKTAMFFAAFLPQFLDPALPPLAQSLAYGALFVAIAAGTDSAWVLAAERLAPSLAKLGAARRHGRVASGLLFIGLGLFTALSGGRARS